LHVLGGKFGLRRIATERRAIAVLRLLMLLVMLVAAVMVETASAFL